MSPSTDHAPGVGEIFRNPTIAQTLREIGTGGKDAFYTGRVAQAIVDVVTKNGGLLSVEDLAKHTSTWVDPISTSYGPVRCALLIFIRRVIFLSRPALTRLVFHVPFSGTCAGCGRSLQTGKG